MAGTKPFVVAVVGPTASGKSDLAVELAQTLGGEVINSDAMQFYRGMDIGTAKMTVAERRGIPHHLIDTHAVTEEASVAEFQKRAREIIARLLQSKRWPIVVGGSGLYTRALLDDFQFPPTDPALRRELEVKAETDLRGVYRELGRLDPAAAEKIGSQNARRVVRALEVVLLTGQPYAASIPQQRYVQPTVQLAVRHDRELLNETINARVDAMWERGFVSEVRSLVSEADFRNATTARGAVGYRQVLDYIDGVCDGESARADTATATRRLVRRQLQWFAKDSRVIWLDAGPDLTERALQVIRDAAHSAG